MALSLRARAADRLARVVDVRVERKLRPATREWQRRLHERVSPLVKRLDRHRDRLDRQSARLDRQGRRIARLETSVKELRRELRLTNTEVERMIPQVAAQEDRIETVRGRLAVAPSTEDGEAAEARRLIEEVQREHSQIRVRLSGIAFYEERLRKLEEAVGALAESVQNVESTLEMAGSEPPRPELTVRPATEDDAEVLLRWRNDPVTRQFSRNHDVVRPEEHVAWLADVLADEDRVLFVLESDGVPVASARYDRVGPGTWESNAAVAPEARGRGLGAEVLSRTQEVLRDGWDAHTIVGMVHEDNAASRSMLRQAGYVVRDDVSPEPPFVPVACYLAGARV